MGLTKCSLLDSVKMLLPIKLIEGGNYERPKQAEP